jgi:hypothetical protein
MAVTPLGYFAGKVRTDKDLSTKLSQRGGKCAAALAGIFFHFSPYLILSCVSRVYCGKNEEIAFETSPLEETRFSIRKLWDGPLAIRDRWNRLYRTMPLVS